MGMYTECFVSGSISPTTEAATILRFMFGEDQKEPPTLPDHPFFTKPRWRMVGQCSSYYFQPRAQRSAWVDEISKNLHFVSRSDLKNYDGEIAAFFDWLKTTGTDFFGYSRYEETPTDLTIYHDEGIQ